MKYCLIDHAWSDPQSNPRFEVVQSVPGLKNVRFRGSFPLAVKTAKYLISLWGGEINVSCAKPEIRAIGATPKK